MPIQYGSSMAPKTRHFGQNQCEATKRRKSDWVSPKGLWETQSEFRRFVAFVRFMVFKGSNLPNVLICIGFRGAFEAMMCRRLRCDIGCVGACHPPPQHGGHPRPSRTHRAPLIECREPWASVAWRASRGMVGWCVPIIQICSPTSRRRRRVNRPSVDLAVAPPGRAGPNHHKPRPEHPWGHKAPVQPCWLGGRRAPSAQAMNNER